MSTFARSAATREDVTREALSWVGTPFHDCAGVKGAGVDCLHLLLRTFVAVGLVEDFSPPPYSPQWFQNRQEPLFLNGVAKYLKCTGEAAASGADELLARALPGDVLMYNFGRHAAHGAIVIDENSIVHASRTAGRAVLDAKHAYAGRLHSSWSAFA